MNEEIEKKKRRKEIKFPTKSIRNKQNDRGRRNEYLIYRDEKKSDIIDEMKKKHGENTQLNYFKKKKKNNEVKIKREKFFLVT